MCSFIRDYPEVDRPHPRSRRHFAFFGLQTSVATEHNGVRFGKTLEEIERVCGKADVGNCNNNNNNVFNL